MLGTMTYDVQNRERENTGGWLVVGPDDVTATS